MSLMNRIQAAAAAKPAEGGIETYKAPDSPPSVDAAPTASAAQGDALLASVAGTVAMTASAVSQEDLEAQFKAQLAEMYEEHSYLMLTQRVLLLKNGGKILPDDNSVITAKNEEQREMLAYWDALNSGLVERLK